MNNTKLTIMKKTFNTIAHTMVMLSLMLSGFATPITATAQTSSEGGSLSTGGLTTGGSVSISCSISASSENITSGGDVEITWNTSGADNVTINGEVVGESGSKMYLNITENTSFNLVATVDGVTCDKTVTVYCEAPESPVGDCTLTPATQTITRGESATLTWTSNGGSGVVFDNGLGNRTSDGSLDVNPTVTTTYTLTVDEGLVVSPHVPKTCSAEVVVVDTVAPTCDSFVASPDVINTGATTTLSWETTNASQVTISGVGTFTDVDSSTEVAPLASTVYTMTVFAADGQTDSCTTPVVVSETPVPTCVFNASPNSLGIGGGDVTLNWSVENASVVEITPSVGVVSQLTGSQVVNVSASTDFSLTATNDEGVQVSCPAPVTVATTDVLTCSDITFTASDYSVDRGDNVTLNWDASAADSVFISEIDATVLVGSEAVEITEDTDFVLTATKDGNPISCPITVEVETGGGGGGGGSASPRCELDISDSRISLGEEITLSWETSRARDITIIDDEGDVLFTTDDMLSDDKEDYLDGEITIIPTRDTEFTLIAERGSRDRECTVDVEVSGSVTVLQTRDQQPLVAGISLSQTPYTGFEAGPFMTMMFYLLLVAWALALTYLLVIRNKTEVVLEGGQVNITETNTDAMTKAKEVRPDVFVESVTPQVSGSVMPTNLPTGAPVIGTNPHVADDATVTDIENRAHEQNALLSSDAIRHFIGTTEGGLERVAALDEVIAAAKSEYALEDGWIVINESRMKDLCIVCQNNAAKAEEDQEEFVLATVPQGSGSLAEAIVTGNVVAAYDMIGNRPMFALADAAADLDAVYRSRKGDQVEVSSLLQEETKNLSGDQIKNMIAALTGAIDGTYTDEASAVKMAIMKAVKELG